MQNIVPNCRKPKLRSRVNSELNNPNPNTNLGVHMLLKKKRKGGTRCPAEADILAAEVATEGGAIVASVARATHGGL